MNQPSPFTLRLRKLAREIPKGRVTTYGILARMAGGGGQAARSVTSILAKDPFPEEIPFHRIVFSNGKISRDESYNKIREKIYKSEGIEITDKHKVKDFEDLVYRFNE